MRDFKSSLGACGGKFPHNYLTSLQSKIATTSNVTVLVGLHTN